ncbi:hypothetical protein DOK76_07665 [Vagococcus sp. DIV0080]|uniref:Flagellar protein FliT n=1 Tax=Candidatus Vagococcus giribetii TaxID=2230876 RepID=A0ABS3HUU1_9ENTE|nr:hypothetical protein [Vagococcus sp. DIV0080]MBO0476943.1 hypothetical protein [Vagococcus sp. DIV0080]
MVNNTICSNNTLKKMVVTIRKWSKDLSLEESIGILEENSKLMSSTNQLFLNELTDEEGELLQELVTKSQELMLYLESQKTMLIDQIGQMNQSEKIATQYIKQFSESYFVDKDF